jgi:hypothetical protein
MGLFVLPPVRPAAEQRAGSDGEAFATLGTTTIQNSTAIGRRHPGTKAVGTLAANVAGLKSTFHRGSHKFK